MARIMEKTLGLELVKRGDRYLVFYNGYCSKIGVEISRDKWEILSLNMLSIKKASDLALYLNGGKYI